MSVDKGFQHADEVSEQKENKVFCHPDGCLECQYVGDGDCICLVTNKPVIVDWTHTIYAMGEGCLHAHNGQGEDR